MATARVQYERLPTLIDDEPEEAEVLQLYNDALDDLSEHAGYTRIAEATLTDASRFTLPADFIEEIEVRYDGRVIEPVTIVARGLFNRRHLLAEDQWPYDQPAYERQANDLVIFRKGRVHGKRVWLQYYAELPHLTSLDDEIPLPRRYHGALNLFVGMRWRQGERDSLGEKRDFQQDYEIMKAQLAAFTQRHRLRTRPGRRTVPRLPWI